jgi:hypothetical protein
VNSTESRFEPKTFDFNAILNHQLSQKLKLIRNYKFNYLINTLTCLKAVGYFIEVSLWCYEEKKKLLVIIFCCDIYNII